MKVHRVALFDRVLRWLVFGAGWVIVAALYVVSWRWAFIV